MKKRFKWRRYLPCSNHLNPNLICRLDNTLKWRAKFNQYVRIVAPLGSHTHHFCNKSIIVRATIDSALADRIDRNEWCILRQIKYVRATFQLTYNYLSLSLEQCAIYLICLLHCNQKTSEYSFFVYASTKLGSITIVATNLRQALLRQVRPTLYPFKGGCLRASSSTVSHQCFH